MKFSDGALEVLPLANTPSRGQVGVVTVLLAWILIASLGPHTLAADCAKAKRGAVSTTNYIKVNQQNWNDNSVVAAASMWNNGGGGYPVFWTGSNNPPGSYAILNVERVVGIAPTRDVCGTFSGLNVKVYTRTVTSDNEIVRCDGNGLAQNVAHEFGHRLGLDDAPAGAPPTSIMAQVNGRNHTVQPCESSLADAINETEEERNEGEKDDTCPGCPEPSSPILLRLVEGRWELTNTEDGVDFDLNADGTRARTPWTAPGSDLAFLFSDRDGDGVATTGAELFGDARPVSNQAEGTDTYTNGFEALVEWDSDRDGWITPLDVNWNQLQLWIDRDHDGVCAGNEVLGLLDQGVAGISLAYKVIGKRDRHGNLFRYVGSSLRQKNGGLKAEKVYDVIFIAE